MTRYYGFTLDYVPGRRRSIAHHVASVTSWEAAMAVERLMDHERSMEWWEQQSDGLLLRIYGTDIPLSAS